MKPNAAIIILAGRKELFKKTLRYFYNNWNNKFNYPVFVHSLKDVFSNDEIFYLKKKYKNLYFERVYPEVPNHINEKDLFYNRVYNDYAYNNFNKGRLGYLHVCYFTSNVSSFGKKGCLCKKLKKFDYIMRLDDDVWFRKKINFDFFKKIKKYHMATGVLTVTKSRKIHLTREKLFSFIKNFTKRNKISIKNNLLKKIIKSNNEKNLFELPYSMGNFEIYNMKIFKSKKFRKFIFSINRFGGQYKYRWADYDITNLFLYIYFKNPILDLNISEKFLKSSHPEAKRIIDEMGFLQKINNFIIKRFKRFLYKIKKN
tara:strand:+ start:85 stop:1026 length:942 start_codon:yes stop_codon:yes gene_type:complete